MARAITVQKLQQILSQIPDIFLHADDILPRHRLRENLGLDSLAMIDLLVNIEDEFSLTFNPVEHDLEKVFETVESLADFVDDQTNSH